MSASEVPSGCLGCNEGPVAAMLEKHGVDRSRFSEVPRPRHNWGDVLCCDECGRAWLITPATALASVDGKDGNGQP